ncbi:MAG TPA: CarD family transcriptional regulator [Roseiarcus sp.]
MKTKAASAAEPKAAPAAAPAKASSPPLAKRAPVAPKTGKPGAVEHAERDDEASVRAAKPVSPRQGFKLNEFVVYPAHGVGQIVAIEDQEVAGFRLELFVINFAKDKMTLRVPTSKVAGVGMRKLSEPDVARKSLDILTGRARVKRTMWSRRAQEYEAKINSGDINAIAEVVRDLYRSDAQPEQSYSERQLYEAALDRMMREIAAVQKLTEMDAFKVIEAQLKKSQRRPAKGEAVEGDEGAIEEAA